MEEMIEQPIKIYVKVNENNEIIDVGSSIFIKDLNGWIKIDEGFGDKYAHAQSQYLEKGLVDEQGRYNYKFVEGKVVEVEEAEKPTIEEQKAVPTEQDKINAQLMLQIAQLKAELKAVK